MVRLKTRWLLVRVDRVGGPNERDGDEDGDDDAGPGNNSTRKDMARAVREAIVQCWGIAASGMAFDTQGACDPKRCVGRCVLFPARAKIFTLTAALTK